MTINMFMRGVAEEMGVDDLCPKQLEECGEWGRGHCKD